MVSSRRNGSEKEKNEPAEAASASVFARFAARSFRLRLHCVDSSSSESLLEEEDGGGGAALVAG